MNFSLPFIPERPEQPRNSGLTMMMDKGLSIRQAEDFLEMSAPYTDLVKQTFNFPQEGFDTDEGNLYFNGLDLKALIAKYGTPLKLSYLPKIGIQIKKAKKMFADAMKKYKYECKYHYK